MKWCRAASVSGTDVKTLHGLTHLILITTLEDRLIMYHLKIWESCWTYRELNTRKEYRSPCRSKSSQLNGKDILLILRAKEIQDLFKEVINFLKRSKAADLSGPQWNQEVWNLLQSILRAWKWKYYSLSLVWLFATPMDYSLPGSSVLGILQARTLEWVAISYSRGSSWSRDWTLF